MNRRTVSIIMQTADRTRMAHVTVPREMRAGDLIKTSTRRWALAFGVNYQIANISTGQMLLPDDLLSTDKVRDGDTLMLQPLATHGIA